MRFTTLCICSALLAGAAALAGAAGAQTHDPSRSGEVRDHTGWQSLPGEVRDDTGWQSLPGEVRDYRRWPARSEETGNQPRLARSSGGSWGRYPGRRRPEAAAYLRPIPPVGNIDLPRLWRTKPRVSGPQTPIDSAGNAGRARRPDGPICPLDSAPSDDWRR